MFGPVISISFPVQVKIPLFQDLNHLPEQYSLFGDLHVKIFSYDTISNNAKAEVASNIVWWPRCKTTCNATGFRAVKKRPSSRHSPAS